MRIGSVSRSGDPEITFLTLPSSLGTLKNLATFSASANYMSGSVPLTIGNLSELQRLSLRGNSFSGRIPSTLGNLRKLEYLDLSKNNFVGIVPIVLFNITTLSDDLDLSSNNLYGSIPQEIGNLKGLVLFSAGWNKLSGEIPITLGECQLLQSLHLQNNMLSGSIPALQGQLQGLESLDLSSNNLSCQIPKFLGNLTMLYYLNLSFNSFVGQVPSFDIFVNASVISMQGNDKLCGGIPDLHLPPCSFQIPKKKHMLLMIPIVITTAATLFILALLYFLCTKCKKGRTEIPSTMSMHGHPLVSYAQLAVATDGFSTINLLGSGSFGTVYKGNLHGESGESSNLVAVKVLKLQSPGSIKSFRAECEALRHVRHRNIVKIVTACLSIDNNGNDFKAFVYEFMPNGSLECWLHPATTSQTEQRSLNLLERVSILLHVAFALDYLHCHGPAPVVHCDLKPSNVLLDADMVAHVGDFGLAKIIVDTSPAIQQSISSMGFRGTIGYAPPEYGAGNTVSAQGDIYSYGILVLETITGKRPTDGKFTQGLSLHGYVEHGINGGRVLDVVDTHLSLGLDDNDRQTADDFFYKRKIDCLVSLLKLGASCSHEIPSNRMSTGDIVKELCYIRESLTHVRQHSAP